MGVKGTNLHWSPPLIHEDGHIIMLSSYGLLELGLQHM